MEPVNRFLSTRNAVRYHGRYFQKSWQCYMYFLNLYFPLCGQAEFICLCCMFAHCILLYDQTFSVSIFVKVI